MPDLILPHHQESVKLIHILDRAQPDYCEICGRHGIELFWARTYMSCVPCSKDVRKARELGVFLPDGGITVAEFMRRLNANRRLQKILFGGTNGIH